MQPEAPGFPLLAPGRDNSPPRLSHPLVSVLCQAGSATRLARYKAAHPKMPWCDPMRLAWRPSPAAETSGVSLSHMEEMLKPYAKPFKRQGEQAGCVLRCAALRCAACNAGGTVQAGGQATPALAEGGGRHPSLCRARTTRALHAWPVPPSPAPSAGDPYSLRSNVLSTQQSEAAAAVAGLSSVGDPASLPDMLYAQMT